MALPLGCVVASVLFSHAPSHGLRGIAFAPNAYPAVFASAEAGPGADWLELARSSAEQASKVAHEAKTLEEQAYAHLYAAKAWRPLDPERTRKHLQLSWALKHGFGEGSIAARELIATCWLVDQAQARAWAKIEKSASWGLPPDSDPDWTESRYHLLLVELINNYDVSGALVAVSLAPEKQRRGFLCDFSGYLSRFDPHKAYKFQTALGIKDGWERSSLVGFSRSSFPELTIQLLEEQGATKAAVIKERLSTTKDKREAERLAAELAKEVQDWSLDKHLSNSDYLEIAVQNNPTAATPILQKLASSVKEPADRNPRQLLAVAGLLAQIDLDQADSLVQIAIGRESKAALVTQHPVGERIVSGYSQFINQLARANPQKAASYLERDVRPREPDLMAEKVFNLVQSMVWEGDPAGLDFANQYEEKEVSVALHNGLLLRQMYEDPRLAKSLFPKLQLDGYEHRFTRYSVTSDLIKRLWESEDSDRLEELFPDPEAIANFFLAQIKDDLLKGGSPLTLAHRTRAVIHKVESDREKAYLYCRLSLLVNPMARDTSMFDKLLSR